MTDPRSPNDALLVFSTCPDAATGARLGRALVEAGAAACVNVLPGITSIYRWRGAVEEAGECLLLAKTTRAGWARLEILLREQHPYELPEIVAVPVAAGLPAYLEWIAAGVVPACA